MRALTQYQVYDGDNGDIIETYANKAKAQERIDFEYSHGRVWATMRTVDVKHFNNTIYHTKEKISC